MSRVKGLNKVREGLMGTTIIRGSRFPRCPAFEHHKRKLTMNGSCLQWLNIWGHPEEPGHRNPPTAHGSDWISPPRAAPAPPATRSRRRPRRWISPGSTWRSYGLFGSRQLAFPKRKLVKRMSEHELVEKCRHVRHDLIWRLGFLAQSSPRGPMFNCPNAKESQLS